MRFLFIVADSLRADAPGWACGKARTPFLDKLASEGTVFAKALSCAPWTVPSMASMVTGVFAHRLGLFRWEQPIPTRYETLFSVLADNRYTVASFVFDPSYLFCSLPEARVVGPSQHADSVFNWISNCPDPNLFVLVHYWGTHFPYLDHPMTVPQWKAMTDKIIQLWNTNPSTMTPKIKGLYSRSVERFSELFLPRLIDAILRHSAGQGACVIVTADHGDSWGERLGGAGKLQSVFDLHGNHLRNEVLQVPLLIWDSERRVRRVLEPVVRTVDLAPTVVELAGIRDAWPPEVCPALDGVSLLPLLRGEQREVDTPSLGCSSRDFVSSTRVAPSTPSELWTALSIQLGNWKLVWNLATGERAAFDLVEDPDECCPRSPGAGEPADGWEQLEREWQRAECAKAPDPGEYQLRSLGYLE